MAEAVRSRRLVLVLGGAALMAMGVAAAVGLRGGKGRSGAEQGRDDRSTDAGRTETGGSSRGRTLAALREGRFDEALAPNAANPGGDLGAGELCALGTALLGQDRLVLGWTALEAARRVDPGHAATNRALDELEGKLVVAVGADQMARREAADEVESLRAVRGGPALGLLVLGLARYGGDRGREREFLDRLLIRERADLRAIETPAGALKLVARLLMETGRAAEASDLLQPLATATPGPGADREAAWLLSRAALQLGRNDVAEAMLERSAGFGAGDTSPEPSPFVGSRKCAECHPSYYRAEQRDNPHARTLYLGSGLKDVPLPERPVPDPFDPRILHGFTRRADDRIDMETRDEKGQVARAVVAYALGSGDHGVTMVTRDEPTGTPRELRISYYTAERGWRATKGIDAVPHDASEFIGLKLSEKALRQCLHCHTTWFRTALPIPTIPSGPEAADRGIGCERCHGPGLNHVKSVAADYGESAIGARADSPPRRLLRSCNECHASNGSVEPSDPEFTRIQGTTLMFSRCFTATKGAIHCATCHDPHRGLDTVRTHYEPKCLACHDPKTASTRPGLEPAAAGSKAAAAAATATATAPAPARAAGSDGKPAAGHPGGPPICPVNASSGCIDCHMPRVQDPSLKMRFTDHHIRVHRQPAAGPAGGG